MKITIDKQEFMEAINRAVKAVPTKTTMPIMECFLLEAYGNEIKLTANDFELGIETKICGMVLENGSVALNAKLLSDIIRKMPENSIYLETDGKWNTTLTCEKCVFHLNGQDAAAFTPIQIIAKDRAITLKQKILKDMIKKTIFSVSKNDKSKLMTSINILINNDQCMRMTALDGHRIAIRYADISTPIKEKINVNIPGKSMDEVGKLLSEDEEEEVILYLEDTHVLFQIGQTLVTSRLVDGDYYRVDQMISPDWSTKLTVGRVALANAIDRAALFIRTEDKKPVKFDIRETEVSIMGDSPFGSLKEEMDVKKEGKNMLIAFNPYYLLDCLKVIDDESIEWCMTNPKAPSYIRNDEAGYLYLILPVNIGK